MAAAALAEAQKLGFAEADPTDDIDGFDAGKRQTIAIGLQLDRIVKRDDGLRQFAGRTHLQAE